jgi:hypothetical protein
MTDYTIRAATGDITVSIENPEIDIADYVAQLYPGATYAEVTVFGQMKLAKVAALTAACQAAIVGGYQSSALGTEHTYPSGITDQINMMGSVTASLLPDVGSGWATPFWCSDQAGDWQFRSHGPEQIRAAGADGKAHVVTCQGILEALSIQAMSATTEADINAIEWPAV